jgi:probable rRNA maturation factor
MVENALPVCVAAVRSPRAPLRRLEYVDATILSDRAIAKVHREFFRDPMPTDVITFPYGEILLGAGVVSENAARFGHDASEEAAFCLIHGLLHLAGWEDRTDRDAKEMAARQEQIFKTARGMLCSGDR